MYSVEDLLISHGYKLPKSGPPSATPYEKRPADGHRELVDNRAGRGTLNGNEAERGASITGIYGSKQVLVKAYPTDNESAERNQRRKEAGIGILGDAQPLGDSLATDSGFYDVPSLTYSEPLSYDERDLSYWRRRGQDFSILLDYADGRELRASAGAWRPQALITAEEYRAERQAQQLWEDLSWLRDPEAAPGQLRVTGERKCQSLGTEDWRPAVGLGRQLSDGDGERWARDQYRLRTPEGFFHPRTKTKSQSLPRVLSPDGTDSRELIPSRPSLPDRQRLSSTVFSGPYSRYVYGGVRDRWSRNAGPSSHVALLPKPRFSRPLKPPSYEIHQQTRGSAEMLAIDQGAKQKDRSIYYSRGVDLRQDYFAQHSAISGMEPPGYIPPPSYKRAPPPRAVTFNRNELANFRWRAETLQMSSSDPGRWFSRQGSGSWLEYYGERAASYRKQVHSGPEEETGQTRQLPIEEPRVKQISGGPSGTSLPDSDKIHNINKEIPSAKTLGQSTHDSAFPSQQQPAPNTETRKAAPSDNDSSNRWCNKVISKKSNSVGPEQNRSQFLPSSILGKPPPPPSKLPDQGVSETVTEVKKVEQPEPQEKDKSKNLKKRLSETIFCLVSVPATPQLCGTIRDQNNNNEKSPDPAGSPSDNKTGHLTNQSLQSTSSAEAELQALTGSMASSKTSSRASSKMFKKLPCRPPKINHYKELKLSGSWPANQYRDQETQTSPEAQKPTSENKEAQQEPAPPGTEVASDNSGVVGTAFSFPIQGVKSLKLSSNSAFSLTSTFSSQLNKSTVQQQTVPPSGNAEEAKPAASSGQETFEQLRLKPTTQRPWDAVKELEMIQKEVQEEQQQQMNKQPSVDKCIEDLNEAYKDILELGTAGNKVSNGSVQIPERIKIRLTSEPLNKPSSLRRSAVSWSVDPEYREIKSAFSRPATKSVTFSKQLREELPVPPRETGFREYRVVSHVSRRRSNDGRTVKLDLPDEPIETPLCDFSPTTRTTAAEVPWADRQPMQDASTLTSPPDYEDICQALRQSKDPTDNRGSAGLSRSNDSELLQDLSANSEEDCPICKRELENQMRQGPLPPLHEENSSDSSANQNGSPPQCAALASPAENLKTEEPGDSSSNQSGSEQGVETKEQHSLTQEGACEKSGDSETENINNSNPAESLPANEATKDFLSTSLSLATDLPAEPQVEDIQSVNETVTEDVELNKQKADEGGAAKSSAGQKTTEMKNELEGCSTTDDKQEQEKRTFSVSDQRVALRTHLGREHPSLPEFPPERLPLSVPPNLDRRLSLSLEGERKTKGPSHRIEALQNKLAISPGRVAVERLARMREVDVICRVRRLSIRSTDSGEGEAEGENKEVEDLHPEPPVDTEKNQESPPFQQVAKETVMLDEKKSLLSESHDPSPGKTV